jgi:hypothetical protein
MWLSVFHSRFARGHATVKGEERKIAVRAGLIFVLITCLPGRTIIAISEH